MCVRVCNSSHYVCVCVASGSARGSGEVGFVSDVRLVFDNCKLYCQPEDSVFKMVACVSTFVLV